MKQCEFCGTILPDGASFCGKCGRVPSQTAHQPTHVGDLPMALQGDPADENASTVLLSLDPNASTNPPTGPLRPITLVPIDEEDDDELRRRAALLGFGIPLLGEVANQQPVGQIPSMSGTPHMGQIPTLPNTPGQGAPPFGPGSPNPQSGPSGWPAPHQPGNFPPPSAPHPPHPHPGAGGTTGGSTGCLTIGAIIAAAALLILSTIIGLGLTVFAPQIKLTGSSSVTPGSSMTLNGSSFLPNSSVTLTRDNDIQLYVSRPSIPAQLVSGYSRNSASAALSLASSQLSGLTNVVPVRGDGTFSVALQVNPSWSLGQHTIYASESVSHRSASLPFTIVQPGTTPTPGATPTDTPTPTPTDTPTPTPTPAPILTCATPGNLALGPVSEGSSQPASGNVTLCTGGSGTLTWQARWDQTQAPWLQVPQSSGTIQAPNQARVTINASAANLKAGTYTATITFIGVESNTTQAVHVTFTVHNCINTTPQQLNFTGTEGVSDPGRQNITVTNCGFTNNWSAQAQTNTGGNWLAVNPTQGTLQSNTQGIITVSVSNVEAKLPAGSYQGSITVTIGTQTATVAVSLTVQPTISAGPNPINSACSQNPDRSTTCTVILTDNPRTMSLSWSATTSSTSVTVKPSSGSIPAGNSETVTITIAAGFCANTTITFTAPGPNNSAAVIWECPPPIT